MPKHNLNTSEDQKLELEDFQDTSNGAVGTSAWQRSPLWLRASGSLLLLAIVLAGSFEFVYAGKIYPGVSADGVYVGGLSQAAAASLIKDRVSTYSGEVVTISSGATDLQIPVASLAAHYDTTQAAKLAASFGRTGNLLDQLHQQLRALVGRASNFSAYSYDDSKLAGYLIGLTDYIGTPVQDASLNFDGGSAQVTPAQTGARLDLGRLTLLVSDRLSETSTDTVTAPVYQLAPDLGTAALQAAATHLTSYLSGPITLSYSGTDHVVNQQTIISWIQVGTKPTKPFMQTLDLAGLYSAPATATLSLNHDAVAAYVANLAGTIDQSAQNAGIAMQNGQLSVVQPSRDGVKVDQADAVNAITSSLARSATDRQVTLKIQTTTAAVNETNLTSLGITGLISEGETYFPGSPAGRLTNVRLGAARFNNVLIAPGEKFSVGAQLGEVDASTGYLPELVIIGNHEELQYGGGLCQVNTTAFRAALLAGLPINEREAHAFAISYYQWPYSAPGVDATIYYPQVDLKFTNDTGHYILIQTTMSGDDLKFDFYGTKVESGVIRGPYFVSGSNNAKAASHTVFYRDVQSPSGQVIRTDTFNSYYQPSTDFPVAATTN